MERRLLTKNKNIMVFKAKQIVRVKSLGWFDATPNSSQKSQKSFKS